MRSSFFGLNVAQQGLYTARTMLDIVNHNIGNKETLGYSRQYGVQVATRPLANGRRGMVGTGAVVEGINQHRNQYLDYKYWSVNKDLGTYDVKSTMLQRMELIFNEPSDIGFTSHFDGMFDALQVLSKEPADEANRANFLASSQSFAEFMVDMGKQLRETQDEANFGVKNSVSQINSYAEQIASLNQQIRNLELNGNRANDLRDQRMVIVDKLSRVVGVEYKVNTDQFGLETVDVTLNGQALVQGNNFHTLEVVQRESQYNPEDSIDIYDVQWSSGKKLYTDKLTGELKGFLDVRDGNGSRNFKGTVISADPATNTLVLNDINRFDLQIPGALNVNGVEYKYNSYTYDEASGEITFDLVDSPPVSLVGEKISMGKSNAFKGVPYYMQQLNTFIRTFASEFNALQQSGNDNTGVPLFLYKGYDGTMEFDINDMSTYTQMSIDNFIINPEMMDDVSLLSTKGSLADGEGANDIILAMINKRQDPTMFSKGTPDNFMQSVMNELAIDVSQMASFKNGQEQLTNMVVNQRLSISDVDLEEETLNLLKYQQAYATSAQVINVFDEIYNITINQMGV